MSTIALTNEVTRYRRQVPATYPLLALLSVFTWEMRRFRASRLFWWQALGFFCLTLCLIWFQPTPLTLNHVVNHVLFLGTVAQTSAWGLIMILPPGTMLVLGMLLPFLNADGVSRDHSRRTYEVLMATALPNWAYVWGRYLCGLVLSLGMALLVLVTLLGMGWFWHMTVANYPAPESGITALGLLQAYAIPLGPTIMSEAQLQQLVLSIENKMPDLAGWFAPHLLAGLSLLLVLIAALAFKRSREVLI